MPETFPANEQAVRKKVLWPIGFTLVVFLLLFLAVFQVYLQRELTRKLDTHIKFVENLYLDFLDERSATMQSLIKQVQRNQVLEQAMIRQDRQALLGEATPLFREFLREQDITHFYFHTPNGVNLLRVHKPDRFGDQIERLTLQQARSNRQTSTGTELGPLGTFTLRVVVPWYAGNKIIGYIEFGEEVEPMLKHIADQTGSEITLLINKGLLDKNSWDEGQKMLGRNVAWGLLPEHVVTATTENQLLSEAFRFVSAPYLSGQNDIKVTLREQRYRGRALPLAELSNRQIGVMMVLQSADKTLSDHRTSIILVAIFCVLLGTSLFASAYTVLGRTDQALRSTRQKLIDEIEKTHLANIQLESEIDEKNVVEQALKEAHNELEQRVVERTAQLDRQKGLLEKTLIKVRQANDRMSGVMRSVDDALVVVDAEDRILLINESAGALLRLDLDDTLGKLASTVIRPAPLRDEVMQILQQREGGSEFDFEIDNSDRQSSLVMHARSSILTDPQGQYEGMIFLARDVTRDRSMDRLKSEFISVAAHELRTPLTTILGFSELLIDGIAGTENDRQEYTQIIHDKAESLSRLLDDMLDISRIESGHGLDLFIENRRVDELFLPTIKQYQLREGTRQFVVELEQPELSLRADPDKIAQVMENLLSNAVKYSPDESSIQISGQVSGAGYRLTISDQGIGMTPEQLSHAFDKFYRGDNADNSIKGTGIGLSIVKHIVEAHQGKIWFESQIDKGSQVHVILPLPC